LIHSTNADSAPQTNPTVSENEQAWRQWTQQESWSHFIIWHRI